MFHLPIISRKLSLWLIKSVKCFFNYVFQVTQKHSADTWSISFKRILSKLAQPVVSWWLTFPRGYGGILKDCWEFSVIKSLRGLYLLKMYRKKEWGGGGGSQADRQTKENYESINSKNINEKNKQAMGCQALAQQRYFPLCAQLDLWDGEQYSPLSSQTLWHKQGNLASPC